MPDRYFFFDGQPGWSRFRIVEFELHQHDEMIEAVRNYVAQHDRPPTVYYGTKLEFEPAEIVKSWKIKETTE